LGRTPVIDNFRKAWRILDVHAKRRAGVLLAMMIAGALAEAASIALVFPLLEAVLNPSQAGTTTLGRLVTGLLGVEGGRENVPWIFALTFAAYLAKNLYLMFMIRYQGAFIWETLATLWIRLYRVYLGWPLTLHASRNTATLVNNVTTAVRNMFYSFVMPVINFLTEFFVVLAVGLLLVIASPLVTLATAAILGGTVLIYHYAFRRPLARWGREQLEQNRLMLLWLNQGLSGIKEIRLMGCENLVAGLFAESARRNAGYSRRNLVVTQLPRYIVEIVLVGSVLSGVYAAYATWDDIREPLPYLALFGLAAMRLMPSASRATTYASHIRFGIASIQAVYADLIDGSADRVGAERNADRDFRAMAFARDIVLDHVSFHYPGVDAPALDDVSLTIGKGEFVALVGRSGAGKTTLSDIIAALLEPTSGEVRVDGRPILDAPRAWQRRIGYVPQDIFLLDDSFAANIAFGTKANAENQQRLREVIELAALRETVDSLPEGVQTRIGERGARLSGGQRQRIGIARSLMRDADLLIFDEATAALDSETEHRITRVLEALRGEKTLIVIAHRLSTVRRCDRLYFLDNGRLVDQGRFEELYGRNAMFRDMVDKMDVSVGAK
jgi:ABC-type multidrug transport system fused ATPase/permease subunit